MKSIGRNIAEFRKQAGFTQEELSERLSVTSQAVSKWENDLSYPDLETTSKLAQVLHVTVDELLNGRTEVPISTNADADRIARRILAIRVNTNLPDMNASVVVRTPAPAIIKAHEDGTLADLVGQKAAQHLEMAVGMLKEGILGPIVDVDQEGTTVKITVEEYEA